MVLRGARYRALIVVVVAVSFERESKLHGWFSKPKSHNKAGVP